jgi:hypothetical protein
MRKSLYLLFMIAVIYSCNSLREVTIDNKQPVAVKTLLESPFGESESVKSLTNRFDKSVKIKRMIRRNVHNAQKVDTIFQFYHGKSKVFVYKTSFNREMLLGGVITDSKFPMINGIVPGITRETFFKSFKDLETTQTDSVNLDSKELTRKFTFIFDSKGILKKISFSLYVD